MKRLVMLTVLGLSLTFAPNGFAAGYGAAGCGFGGELIKENKVLHQIGAAILNMILGNQTFGMTSGTSGCGEDGLVLAENEQETFVGNNYETLTKEMASGKGENLTTLAGLLGCSSDTVQHFGSFTQAHYPSIFKTRETTPSEMLVALKDGLSLEPTLASSCQKI
ncbi:MAG: DUF3015 domain-containing protein [Nitrospirae bacterium]|nr:DUF3015 domain-containing protein [Candidatus Manganitrophaceae bacterium]